MGNIKVLVGCQNNDCAAEVSYHLDMVKMLDGEPICENCYDEENLAGMTEEEWENRKSWSELPPVKMADLCE